MADRDLPTRIRVLERLALMGPNLYAHRPCIKWKIDLGELEERPTNEIPRFFERLKAAMPSLVAHRCSEGVEGGFFSRVEEGTWLGHVMEHIALELQSLVGIDVGFGRTRSAGAHGVYNVVYECDERETGIEAGEIALEMIEAFAADEDFDLEPRIVHLRRTKDRRSLGPSTRAIVDAAHKRGIPWMRLDETSSYVQLGYGANAKKIQATIASTTRHLAVEIAGDKDRTKSLLRFYGIPVPQGEVTSRIETAVDIAKEIGWPVVVKPLDASQGRGIITNIRNEEELRLAFEEAKRHRNLIVVERHLEGSDFRLLVEIENEDPRRGESHEKVMTKIRLDESTCKLLALRGLSVDSVPPKGERVFLKTTANLSTGGTAVDVTDHVHPANLELAERISRLIDLDICGIDIVAPTIESPLSEIGGGVVEVNAAPGFRMHLAPTEGRSRPVGEAVVDMLFPPGCESRIPIITITGTNGKTTTARLCAHIARQSGKYVGLTTSDGIYIGNQLVQKGDTTGPTSAAVVLRDPLVNFAVLETARGGILRAGVAYDWSNAAVVTNIAEDHLGLRDINTLEDLANVKAVTVERVMPEGYAILNAEDGMTPVIRQHVDSRLALFSLDPQNRTFRDHVDDGGLGATLESGWLVLYDRRMRVALCEAVRVPISFGGRARFNIANALAAALATYATKIAVSDIVAGLLSFFQSSFTTPGRLNFVEFDGFRVLVDYAHNPHGLGALMELVGAMRSGRVVTVLGLPGDRRDTDIRESARIVGNIADRVIIREDIDLRGRRTGEVAALIRESVAAAGVAPERITFERDQFRAISMAVEEARDGDLIVYIADKPEIALRHVEELRRRVFGSGEPAETLQAS